MRGHSAWATTRGCCPRCTPTTATRPVRGWPSGRARALSWSRPDGFWKRWATTTWRGSRSWTARPGRPRSTGACPVSAAGPGRTGSSGSTWNSAAEDRRIRGVVTVGAPVAEFFTDRQWQAQLPRITADTLAHMAGVKTGELSRVLPPMALSREQLASLDIPVAYTASKRDEIIPAGEVRLLTETVRDLRVVEHDDVHGSPRHVAETRVWGALSLLRMRGGGGPRRLLFATALRLLRARARFAS